MAELTVVRDETRPYAVCPKCRSRLDLPSLDGQRWIARSPADIADRLMLEMAALEQEQLRVIVLDTKNVVVRMRTVYQGTVNSAHCRVAELLRDAVALGMPNLLVAHQHPSGDPTPSPDDLHLTAEILAAAKLLDLRLLDHLIIGRGTWVSLRDRGIQFSI